MRLLPLSAAKDIDQPAAIAVIEGRVTVRPAIGVL
jgi:hypothetical protein